MDLILKKEVIGISEKDAKTLVFNSYKNLGFGISSSFGRPLGVTITSIFENNKSEKFICHIFIEELLDGDKMRIELMAKKYKQIVIFYYVNPKYFEKVKTSNQILKATYYRMIGAEQMKDKADYLLWLDSDIVCCGELTSLFDRKIEDKIMAVVLHAKQKGLVSNRISELGLKSGKYFNAGILYINVKNWNKFNTNEKVLEMIKNPSPRWKIYDQDMLNELLDGKYEVLPYIYNFQRINGSDEYKKIPSDLRIFHFVGVQKPWLNYKSEFQYKWLEYWKLSYWNDIPLEQLEFKKSNSSQFRHISKVCFKDGEILSGIRNYIKYLKLKHS